MSRGHAHGPFSTESNLRVQNVLRMTANSSAQVYVYASPTNPVLLKFRPYTQVAFATGLNQLSLGYTGSLTAYVAPSDATPGTVNTLSPEKAYVLFADTNIIATMVNTAVAAVSTLTSNNTNVANAVTVVIGTTTYTFKTSLTPTAGEVLIGADADASLLNLIRAINHTGTPGTDYANAGSTAVANTQVSAASAVTAHAFVITALTGGAAGNSIATTESSATLSWTSTVMAGGSDAPTVGEVDVFIDA